MVVVAGSVLLAETKAASFGLGKQLGGRLVLDSAAALGPSFPRLLLLLTQHMHVGQAR